MIRILCHADTVFFEGSQSRTDIEKLARSGDALRGMREAIPPWLKKRIDIDRLDSGTKLIFSALQHPRLNKQVSVCSSIISWSI